MNHWKLAVVAIVALALYPALARAQGGTWTALPPLPGDFEPVPCEPDPEGETGLPCLDVADPGFIGGGFVAPAGAQTPLMLMDGSVFVHQNRSLNWWRLVPDANGDYGNGTWSQTAPMIAKPAYDYNPLYYCSAVLPDGRVVVMGGEYNWEANATTGVFSYVVRELNRGEIYNPYSDTWTALPGPSGWTQIGDMMCTVMPSTGRLMLARQSSTQLATLNPATLAWTSFTPTGKTGSDSNSEEGWTLLPDGTVMVVNANTGMSSQRFITNGTAAGQWVNAGTIPVQMRDSSSHETGAQVLMYNGKVFAVGANRNTGANAVFTPPPTQNPPSTALGSWVAAPAFPRKPYAAVLPSTNCTGTAPNLMCQLDQADGPGVLMPNGRVLVNAGPGVFNKDTYWFEYDPTDDSLTEVPRPPNSETKVQYQYHMVLLPSGQVFAPDGSAVVPVYSPNGGGPDPSWAPTITAVPKSLKPGNSYSLSGTQLNGLSEANSYGDDYASATNYPFIKITNQATGHVMFARAHDRNNLNVATGGTIITTQFDVPANLELGTSTVVVVANGIPSAPVEVNHPPVTTATLVGTAGENGWFVSDVEVTLTATDADGADDIVATYYSIDGGPVQTYAGPFTVSGDLKHTVSFWSVDQAGNQDSPGKSVSIWIDTTTPSISASASVTAIWPPNHDMVPDQISGSIADAGSGIDLTTVVFHVVDEYGQIQPTGAVTLAADGSYSFTIQLEASRLGQDANGRSYQIVLDASDLAGHPVSISTLVIVPHDQGQ